MQSKLNIVIVTHLADSVLLDCIRSIEANHVFSERVEKLCVLVSNEQRVEITTTHSVIQFEDNIGYAQAVNYAFQHFGDNPLLILNDDIEMQRDCLEQLLANYQEDTVLQPAIRSHQNRSEIENCGHTVLFDGSNRAHSRGQQHCTTGSSLRLCFSGAMFLIPPTVIQKTGLFDPDLSPFGEDLDYSLRVIRQGFQIRVIHEAVVFHRLGYSYGRVSFQKIKYVESHRIQAKFRSMPWLSFSIAPFSSLRRYFHSQDNPLLKTTDYPIAALATLAGILDGYRKLPSALSKRWATDNLVSDRKFFEYLLRQQ